MTMHTASNNMPNTAMPNKVTSKTLEPKTNDFCERYLAALKHHALPDTLAHKEILYKAELDYSASSLKRLNSLLTQLKEKTNPQLADYKASKEKTLFLCLLAFYLGDYMAKLTDEDIHWFQGKNYFSTSNPNEAQGYHNKFVCEINGQLIKPLSFIAKTLFTHNPVELQEFISLSLDLITNPQPTPQAVPSNIQVQATVHPLNQTAAEQPETTVLAAAEKPSTQVTRTDTEHSTATQQQSPTTSTSAYKNLQAKGSPRREARYEQRQEQETKHTLPDQKTDLDYASHRLSQSYTDDESYEAKFNINYNSNILERFKPPILPSVLMTVPLALLFLYQLYGIYSHFQEKGNVSIIAVVFAILSFLVMVAIWVYYHMSSINVFDNKVTITTPIKNQTTRFDKRVRFFHIQGDGKFMGETDHVVVKSNTEMIKIKAQQHEAVTELLMEVEASLLVPSLLRRLQNGETVTFASLKINDHAIQYGNIETHINNIGDYEIEDSYLYLYKKDGELFARIGINSEPNINSFLTVLNEFIEIDKEQVAV